MALLDKVEAMGGAVAAIEAGFVQREIEDSAYRYARAVDAGEQVVVGVNRYGGDDEPVPILTVDPTLEAEQAARVRAVRSGRDQSAVAGALAEVRRAAESDGNVLLPMKAALAARATLGEVSGVLREVFGSYRPRP